MARPSIYEFAGGDRAWLEFTATFHERCLADPELNKRFVACFMQAADEVGLPNDPEFRDTLRSYVEWAVREVDQFSPHGSVAPEGQPMPHWSWDGLQT